MHSNMDKELKTPDIYLLVKGLSGNEKSYYKKMAKRHANENSALHLKLFQLIADSKEHNEELLCNELQIENRVHFCGLKTYLYKDILDTLVFLRRNDLVDSQLYFMLEEIKSLLEKRLLNLAQKLCNKAIALAELYNKYHLLVLLFHLRIQVLRHKNYKESKASSDLEFANLEKILYCQGIFSQNKVLYEKVNALKHWNWLPITDEEKCKISLEKNKLKAIEPVDDNQTLSSLYYLNTLALCQYMLNETRSCTDTCSKLYHLWQSSSHLINEESYLFLNTISTTCYNNFLCADLPLVLENLKAYSHLAANLHNEIYYKYFEVIRFNTELKLYLKTASFSQVKYLIDNHAATMFSYSANAMVPADQLSIGCTVSIALFVLERWDDSEALLNIIKEQNQQVEREDILYFSCLFFLLILYEKKQWDRLYHAIESSYHFLYARKKLRCFEREMIQFVKRLSASNSIGHSNQLIKKFLTHLDIYKSDSCKRLYFLYFNYYGWLESKLMNLSYMDYIQHQNLVKTERDLD